MALLAAYAIDSKNNKSLDDFLNNEVFKSCKKTTAAPENELIESFNIYFERYMKGLEIERAAVNTL